MANEFNRSEINSDRRSLTELELLEALLAPDETSYPWNPSDPESEAYFEEQEQQLLLEDWWEEEIAERSSKFFSQIEQIWGDTVPAQPTEVTQVNHLQANLQRFAAYIPQGWLQAIALKAHQVLKNKKSVADQLVQCVQELLPNWAEDDLLVLARPFAYTMRGVDPIQNTEVVESVLGNACRQEWKTLSDIEQARASLAIARYALAQLQNQDA